MFLIHREKPNKEDNHLKVKSLQKNVLLYLSLDNHTLLRSTELTNSMIKLFMG